MWSRYNVFEFKNPFVEVALMQAFILGVFFWLNMTEKMTDADEKLEIQGVQFAQFMTSKKAYSLQYLIFLTLPVTETILLAIILLVGLQVIDLYHIAFLFLFNGFLVFPKKKEIMTKLLVFISAFFVLAKYFFTLVDQKTVDKNFLQMIGLWSPNFEASKEQVFFEYSFHLMQWSVLFLSLTWSYIQRFFKDKERIQECSKNAKRNLRMRYPKLNRIFQFIYNLKRNIIIIAIFVVFYIVVQSYSRCLINWGFLVITSILLYVQLSFFGFAMRQRFWSVMIYYSSIIMLVTISFMFCQLPYIWDSDFMRNIGSHLPDWMRTHQEIIGLKALTTEEFNES